MSPSKKNNNKKNFTSTKIIKIKMSKLYRPNIENNSLNNRGNNTNQINKKFWNFNGKFGTSFMNNNSLSIDQKLIFGKIMLVELLNMFIVIAKMNKMNIFYKYSIIN